MSRLLMILGGSLAAYGCAVSCGGASRTGPSATGVGVTAGGAASVPTATAPKCHPLAELDEARGCVFEAPGTPPADRGGAMKPVPAGRTSGLTSFWLDPHRVTRAAYDACVQAGKCTAADSCDEGESGPAAAPHQCASWTQAERYCAWAGKRLPQDAEWAHSANHAAALSLEGLDQAPPEWTASYYCSDQIGGCGHSRVFRGMPWKGASEMVRGRVMPAGNAFTFRCAWSTTPPRAPQSPPPLLAVPATTPGRIQCLTTTCDLATQICCANEQDGVGRCVSKPADGSYLPPERRCKDAQSGAGYEEETVWCDESADCSGGQACCSDFSSGIPPGARVCSDHPCESGGELCLPGGSCRKGFECKSKAGDTSGSCAWKDQGARCGAKRCSGATPHCCWNPQTRKGYCSKDKCQDCMAETRFDCTSPRDCGDYICADRLNLPEREQLCEMGGEHAYSCTVRSTFMGEPLCNTLADCPRNISASAPATGCAHRPELPPGVKACAYH